jgi:peptidoglycan/LPS O-acetylase OafA/YrhL
MAAELSARVPRQADSTLVRFAAVLLIANSHLEALYPRPWLAGDGLLGNSLFFMVSGCGLALGNASFQRSFWQWYGRRLLRIYPAVFLFVLVVNVMVEHAYSEWTPVRYLEEFVWPTSFGFIRLIVLFYIAFFFLLRIANAKVYLAAIGILILPLVWLYIRDASKIPIGGRLSLYTLDPRIYVIFDFALMLLGGYMSTQTKRFRAGIFRDGIAALVLFFGYLVIKYAMVVRGDASRGYGVLFLIVALLCYFSFRVSQAPSLLALVGSSSWVSRAIRGIGAITLEIYLVHRWGAELLPVARTPFPFNIAAFWIVTLILAYALAWAAGWIRGKIMPEA